MGGETSCELQILEWHVVFSGVTGVYVTPTSWMSQEVSKWLGSVGYNPKE